MSVFEPQVVDPCDSATARVLPLSSGRRAVEERPSWQAYAIAVPVVLIGAQILYLFRHELAAGAEAALDLGLRWVGAYLLVPFVVLLVVQVVAIFRLLTGRRPGPRVALTPGARLEWVASTAPSLGFLGTILGLCTFLGNLDSEVFNGLDGALGTTAIGLVIVLSAQLARLLFSNEYRALLNEEAGVQQVAADKDPDGR